VIKKIIKNTFKAFGLDISKVNKVKKVSLGLYESLMLGVLSSLGGLNIVQIGANDGAINDPIYDFVMKYKQFTRILLIEPQTDVIPYLEHNYLAHPNKIIFNGAIGSEDVLVLYRIKKEFRSSFIPPYAKGWPIYRAATGVVSSKKEFVVNWARKITKKPSNIDEAIETINVPCMKLQHLIQKVKFGNQVDVLQIDTEGTDDVVIYNSSINIFKPRIINYESKALSMGDNEKLKSFLAEHGYITFKRGGDTLAILLP
jgi:FkbM family methyltransferase